MCVSEFQHTNRKMVEVEYTFRVKVKLTLGCLEAFFQKINAIERIFVEKMSRIS